MILTSSLVVLQVTVAGDGEQEDYIVFCEDICQEWDCLHDAVCTQYHFTLCTLKLSYRNRRRP